MADNSNESETSEAPSTFDSSSDFFLRHIVKFANDYGISQGITVNVDGAIVSGTIISGKEYFKKLADTVLSENRGGANPDIVKSISDMYRGFTAIYDKPEDADENYVSPDPAFIHLEGAKWFAPDGKRIPTHGVLWRGRLNCISGFSLGVFN